MQNNRNRLLSILFILIISFCTSISAYGFNTYPNNYKLNGGIGNYGRDIRYYFITPSAGVYSGLISDAVSSWMDTKFRLGITTPISIASTSIQNQSAFDFYQISFEGDYNAIAATDWYVYQTPISNFIGLPSQNWDWSRINLNSNVIPRLSSYNQQGTIAHELGHAMGLAHTSNLNAIMSQLGGGNHRRKVNMPQADDCNGVNFLYSYVNSFHNQSKILGDRGKYFSNTLSIISECCDMLHSYDDIDSLYKASEYVVAGKVIDVKPRGSGSYIYSDATIKVSQGFKGNIGTDKEIKVIFQGGTLDGDPAKKFIADLYKQKFRKDYKGPLPDKAQQNYNQLDNIQKGDSVILFLQDKSKESRGKCNYALTGGYQGRFIIKDGKAELHDELKNPKNDKLYSSDKKSFNEDNFVKYLKKLNSSK